MYKFNNDTLKRTLFESTVVPEIVSAIQDWIAETNSPGVLIGGLALSFYGKPRHTMDVDMIYVTDQQIPQTVNGFKRIRDHSFQHNKTHVEIEVLSASFLGIPTSLVQYVIQTAEESDGVKIASKSGLVALKLQRCELQDQADIEQLIKIGGINLKPYQKWLTKKQIESFNNIQYNN